MPALHSYAEMWKRFNVSNPKGKGNFNIISKGNQNNLFDSLILFSIRPEENIHIVTNENLIHKYFNDLGYSDYVHYLNEYLTEIEFI